MSQLTENRSEFPRPILASVTLMLALMLCLSPAPASAQNNRSIKVMTQNMDAGTDLGFIFGLPDNPVLGAQMTLQELNQSMIPQRAQRLAAEIAAAKPDLISLQEATIWAVTTPDGPLVLFDQLDLLMEALAARGEQYEVVNLQLLTQAGAPLKSDQSQFLLFNDRDVILARTGGKHSELSISNPLHADYENLFEFGGFKELHGWISVDVEVQGTEFRFFNTHLESTSALFPDMETIQVLQGGELIQALNASPLPVIVAGDFNSDASGLRIGPDLTDTADNIQKAGYTEVWGALHLPDHGLTWPRYLEDIPTLPTSQVLATPTERIDLVFAKGVTPLHIERTLRANPPLASDHVGILATLRFEK